MDGGDAGGSGVKVTAVRPGTVLRGAIGELDLTAVANGPVAATGAAARFEDGASETGLAQLVGGDQAGDAGAKDDHALPVAKIRGELGEGRRAGGSRETQYLHGAKGCGIAADLGDALQEDTSSEAHWCRLHVNFL